MNPGVLGAVAFFLFLAGGCLFLALAFRLSRRRIEEAKEEDFLPEQIEQAQVQQIEQAKDVTLLEVEKKLRALQDLNNYYVNSSTLAAAAMGAWLTAEIEEVLIKSGHKIERTVSPNEAETTYRVFRARNEEAMFMFQLGSSALVEAHVKPTAEEAPVVKNPESSPDDEEPPKGTLLN